MKRRALLSATGVLAANGVAGCLNDLGVGPVSESLSNTYSVSPETRVLVSNRNGPVAIHEANGDALTVSTEKQAGSQDGLDSITIDIVEGERFVINVRFSTGSDFSNRRVDLSVGLPEGVAIDAANTANGDVTVSEVRGDVNAATVNGDVTVTDVSGFVRTESTNGDVRIRNCTGVTGARTANGRVDVELLAMRADVTCSASSGNVWVRVGPDVSAAFRLSTNSGNARVSGVPHTTTLERQGYIVGSLRGGDRPLLFLGSNNGDVTIQPA